MRSPFAIFRKHQKLLTVILTGLAMFAFVILGAVNDPTNMPTGLIVVFVAAVLGSIGWVLGIRSKRSNEYGLAGVAAGAILALAGTMAIGPRAVVKADTGDISADEFAFLQYQRARANEFIARVAQATRQKSGNQFVQPPAPFTFNQYPEERDIVVGELLRREARDLGIMVPEQMVGDYIAAISQGKLGKEDLNAIRNAMGLSETDIYRFLASEIQARLAYQQLYDWAPVSSRAYGAVLPPESYWDFYQRLNIRQSVDIVPVPVSAFLDKSVEPDDSQLRQLFDEYKDDFPNLSPEGRIEEGRPGFRQPRKVRLAYLEAAYDAIEATVDPPTDAEIEEFYNEQYKTIPDDAIHQGGAAQDGPASEAAEGAEGGPAPADSSTIAPPADDATPTGESGPAEGTRDGDLPSTEGLKDNPPAPAGATDSPESESDSAAPGPADPEQSNGGASLVPSATTQLVAFFEDTETAENAAASIDDDADTTAEAQTPVEPAGEQPPSGEPPSAAQAGDDSETASALPPPPPLPQSDDSAGTLPPLPAPAVRKLDDELRSEIRDQLLRERTREKMQRVVEEALNFMRELELRLANLPEDADYLTPKQALEELRAYGEKNGLVYAETPLLSAFELQNSEEYPIGSAVDQLFSDPFNPRPATSVLEQVFTSEPREVFRSRSVTHPETDSRFVYWKIEDRAEYEPESLSDPGIREQVVATWRELQAREKAQARAAELARTAAAADQPLSEIFAGQTVTGTADGPAISVLHPPSFSWLSKADPRLSPNPFTTPPPELTRLRNVPGRIGESFMETVFNELRPGEAGVAHSVDKDYFYVVRVHDRSYGRADDLAGFREAFLREPVFGQYFTSDYPKLAQGELASYQTDWSEALFQKHGAEIIPREHASETEEAETAGGPAGSYY